MLPPNKVPISQLGHSVAYGVPMGDVGQHTRKLPLVEMSPTVEIKQNVSCFSNIQFKQRVE